MIRKIISGELPLCLDIARLFFIEGKLPGNFNAEIFLKNWDYFYQEERGQIYGIFKESELCGGIGGIVFPDPNTGDIIATEMFWYVKPEYRKGIAPLKLLQYYEAWAIEKGAKRIMMVCLTLLQNNRLTKLYDRYGYKKIETHFIKEVS